MKIETIKAVIYDLDGTLYQRKGIKFHFAYIFIFKLKLMLSFLKIRKNIEGQDFGSMSKLQKYQVSQLSMLSNKTEEESKKFIEYFMQQFVFILKKYYQTEKQMAASINFFKMQNIPLICLSDYLLIKERLTAIGMNPNIFSLIRSSEEYGALKPSSKSFLAIADELQIAPANILVIGDRYDTDGEGAEKSGMQFVKYPENFNQINNIVNA